MWTSVAATPAGMEETVSTELVVSGVSVRTIGAVRDASTVSGIIYNDYFYNTCLLLFDVGIKK